MFQPFGNTTVLPPAEWHPEPQRRGTFSILSSCLITMSLCIWTSLHLNLPEHKKEHMQKYRKLGWMVLGLLAPELVVWNAWEQRKEVKRLSDFMVERGFMPKRPGFWESLRSCWIARAWWKMQVLLLLRAEDWPELANPRERYGPNGVRVHAWTDVHSWLVIMGGMAFEDTAPESRQFMPGDRQRIPLTPCVFKWWVRERPLLVPDISRGYIEDKSKSDLLAKVLTCWQAGYFCIQCTFRLSQRLSITLLELNVFAHAICALLLFLVWWDKPRDVQEPCPIPGEEALDVCAFIMVQHADSESKGGRFGFKTSRDLISPPIQPPQPPGKCFEVSRPTTFGVRLNREGVVVVVGINECPYLNVRGTYWEVKTCLFVGHFQVANRTLTLKSRDIERMVRAYMAFTKFLALALLREHTSEQRVHDRITDWNSALQYQLGSGFKTMDLNFCWLVAGMTFVGVCYGGLHLTAWTNQFPSFAEATMWRAASVTIFASGFLYALYIAAARMVSFFERCINSSVLEAKIRDMLVSSFLYSYFASGALFLLWYSLCRAFIVVECFIMLAHIPESALEVPTWSTYIPHIA